MDYAIVILCGGKSSRMGTDKALLPFGDCCLIEYLVQKFQPYFSKIYLSVQQKSDYSHLNLPVTMIPDVYFNAGPLAGIFSALSMIREKQAFFLSVDTPFVEPALACRLLDECGDYDICAIERSNEQLETLSAVYSKNCTSRIGKSLLLRQYSLNTLHDKCSTRYLAESDLNEGCSIPVTAQLYNMNTRSDYYNALRILLERGEISLHSTNKTEQLYQTKTPYIPVISFVGDSIIDKKFYMRQLLSALEKDGMKAAIFDYDKKTSPAILLQDLQAITNVDLILTRNIEEEGFFKIELLSKEINEEPLHPLTDLIAVVSDFNYKSELPCFDYHRPKMMLNFLQDFIRDYGI